VVEDQRSGLHRLVRRVGDSRRVAALALRECRAHQARRAALATLHLDGLQGDRPVHHHADDLHRDRGTSLKSALDVARKFGEVRDADLPFSTGALYAGDTQTFYALASQLKILSYFNVGTNLTNWKAWLATKGPILTRLDVDKTWDDATTNAGNMDEYQPDTTRGGHAVAIVGYKRDRFIVRNSWGTGWGDKGFGYASLAYAQAAFTEAYGVAV